MKLSNQYLSFLGGEVSESLWHRTDMDKFNKWFANAENIRFTTMGSFANRPGFKRLGPVLDHQLKPVVKLIPFVFNNEEVFEIEFVTGQFRVRKNGEVIIRDDGSEVVYDSPIKIESLQQLKYAQSGDIIFIASGTSPVMELRRLKTDGTAWRLKEFSGDTMPLLDTNEDDKNNVSLEPVDESAVNAYEKAFFHILDPLYKYALIPNPYAHPFDYFIFKQIKFVFNFSESDIKHVREFQEVTMQQAVTELLQDELLKNVLDIKVSGEVKTGGSLNRQKGYLKLEISGKEKAFSSVEVYLPQAEEIEKVFDPDYSIIGQSVFKIENIGDSFYPTSGYREYGNGNFINYFGDSTKQVSSFDECAEVLSENDDVGLNTVTIEKPGKEILFVVDTPFKSPLWILYVKKYTGIFKHNFSPLSTTFPNYTAKFSGETDFSLNTVFCIRNRIEAEEIVETIKATTSWKSKEVLGNGKWRYYTSGNWKGEIRIFFSEDNKKTWKLLRTTISNKKEEPGIFNENTSGTIETKETISYKIEANVSEGEVNINFMTNAFDVNSYYKILGKGDINNYLVACVKNDVGQVLGKTNWRGPAFSDTLGYPDSIGFYQNRLFFGKGYELWGSKLNDYWDFYEPVDLQKDDPINISILTYKVNTIKNILTTKSFFVFTSGGEFGIASQGAISQDDKFLKQFSSHGSNDCQPLIVGNLVVFVDSTGNTVRAFQYSFESDSYEANDITIFIEDKLKGKQIITTEYIKSTKECLFLDSDGVIWVFKYMPEQNIMAWSHWKHGQYKITNLCVSPRGAYDDLYVVVDAPDGKFIEKLDEDIYSDSVEVYLFEEPVEEVQTQLVEGKVVNVDDGINNKYKVTVGEFGKVKLRSPSMYIKIGLSYNSTATLLTPTISLQDGTYTTFRKQKLNKAYFIYKDSFGFKVGEENSEKMEIEFQSPADSIESQVNLSSGKKSVLIPNTYDGTARLSFVQDEPYPMKIVNVLLESDYGGQ